MKLLQERGQTFRDGLLNVIELDPDGTNRPSEDVRIHGSFRRDSGHATDIARRQNLTHLRLERVAFADRKGAAGGRENSYFGVLAIEPWPPINTFRQALNNLGYIEGKNVRFEYRYAKGDNERLPELANNFVGLNVDVIVTWGTDAALAAKQATTTIPIVMGTIGDPLGIGIVTNLAHPGANITGFSSRAAELGAKRLQLLKEVFPGLSRVAILLNPTNHYMPFQLQKARKGAQMLHLSLAVYEAHDITTLNAGFVQLTKNRPDGLLVSGDTL